MCNPFSDVFVYSVYKSTYLKSFIYSTFEKYSLNTYYNTTRNVSSYDRFYFFEQVLFSSRSYLTTFI